eukprot:5727218-Alexandrium_andersonii.AAC.1
MATTPPVAFAARGSTGDASILQPPAATARATEGCRDCVLLDTEQTSAAMLIVQGTQDAMRA